MWQQRLAALTQKKREEIWLLRDDGMTLDQLARRYGVNVGTISRTCSNRRQTTNVRAVPELAGSDLLKTAEYFEQEQGFKGGVAIRHKLTLEQREEAWRLRQAGQTLKQIASHFGVSEQTIWTLVDARRHSEAESSRSEHREETPSAKPAPEASLAERRERQSRRPTAQKASH